MSVDEPLGLILVHQIVEHLKPLARRCKRCGGLLTSSQGLRDGYGPCCLRKIKQEEADRKMMENQCSLFDMGATAPKREGD